MAASLGKKRINVAGAPCVAAWRGSTAQVGVCQLPLHRHHLLDLDAQTQLSRLPLPFPHITWLASLPLSTVATVDAVDAIATHLSEMNRSQSYRTSIWRHTNEPSPKPLHV